MRLTIMKQAAVIAGSVPDMLHFPSLSHDCHDCILSSLKGEIPNCDKECVNEHGQSVTTQNMAVNESCHPGLTIDCIVRDQATFASFWHN